MEPERRGGAEKVEKLSFSAVMHIDGSEAVGKLAFNGGMHVVKSRNKGGKWLLIGYVKKWRSNLGFNSGNAYRWENYYWTIGEMHTERGIWVSYKNVCKKERVENKLLV